MRVLDFGLAQTAAEESGEVAGTPRYMAPEHLAGAPATAASDQFSFCVALREAIAGAGDVPRWIEAIVVRGTSSDPAARFPSMRELLHALARDPRRLWRFRIAGALAIAAIAAAFVIGWSRGSTEHPALCAGSEAELEAAWGAARGRVAKHLAMLGETKVVRDLDGYRATWIAAHRGACVAHEQGELPVTFYERRLACLARAKAALGAAADLLGTVPADRLDNALVAAHSLPDAGRCDDDDAAQIAPPPAGQASQVSIVATAIERARVLAVAVEPGAEQVARATVRAAELTRYPPVLARALLVQGRAEMAIEDPVASATFARAVRIAIEAGDDPTAIEAYAREVFVAADREVDGRSVIEPLAIRLASRGAIPRALLYNNLATAKLGRGDRDGARALLLEARRQFPGDPADADIELVCIAQNLALVASSPGERERELGSVAVTLARVLGEGHANTLEARTLHALATQNGVSARARQTAACADYQRKPHLAAARAWCEFERAWLADEIDDVAVATAAMTVAASDPVPDRRYAEIAAGFVALARKTDPQRSITELRALGAKLAELPQSWKRIRGADAYIAAARGAEWNKLPSADSWSAALAILEAIDRPIYQRRLARVRAALARQLVRSRPDEARRLATLARDWYVAAGGYDDVIAKLPR